MRNMTQQEYAEARFEAELEDMIDNEIKNGK